MSSRVLQDARRIVVKVGSSLVTNEGRGLDEAAIDLVADIIRQEKERGALIILACHDYGYLSGASDEIFKLVGGKLAHHLTKCENDVFSEVSQ